MQFCVATHFLFMSVEYGRLGGRSKIMSDFLGGGRDKRNMTRGVDSLANIGHPMFLQFFSLSFMIF